MSLGDFLGRLGDNIATNVSNAPPDAWFALANSLTNAPRNNFAGGLSQGLSGFSQATQAEQKKNGLAAALSGAMGGFSQQQQDFLKALGPDAAETVAPVVMQNLFKQPAQPTDHIRDYEYAQRTGGFKGSLMDFLQAEKAIPTPPPAPIPGTNFSVDAMGNLIPGAGAPSSPSPRPMPPRVPQEPRPVAPEPRPANIAAPSGPDAIGSLDPSVAPSTAPTISVAPNGQGAPAPTPIPLQGAALQRMHLPTPTQGKQWALDPQTLRPTQVDAPGGSNTYDLTDPKQRDFIKGIVEYRIRPTSASRNPAQHQAQVEAAQSMDPDYNEAYFGEASKTRSSFQNGYDSKTVAALNNSVQHLDLIAGAAKALEGGDVRALNSLRNRWLTAFGSPLPGNLSGIASTAALETAKALLPGGGGEAERQEFQSRFANYASQGQLSGAVDTQIALMKGQFNTLQNKYEIGTKGAKDFDHYILPEAKSAFDRVDKLRAAPTDAQINATAKKYGITREQVIQRLKSAGAM